MTFFPRDLAVFDKKPLWFVWKNGKKIFSFETATLFFFNSVLGNKGSVEIRPIIFYKCYFSVELRVCCKTINDQEWL